MGMMGAGKSYWAQRCAADFNLPTVDLDLLLEKKYGEPIADLLLRCGEEKFRTMETAALLDLLPQPPCIVALGGGTPCFNNNIAWLKQMGTCVFLSVPIDILAARLKGSEKMRPLLATHAFEDLHTRLNNLLSQRLHAYQQAHHTIHDTGEPIKMVEALHQIINQLAGSSPP